MSSRGRERLVHCEKCGRTVRRDKAVYIEKPILQNPLDRNQIAEPSTYRAVLTREVAYCPGCGKHLRVYEKKIKQNIRDEERAARAREFGFRGGPGGFGHGPGGFHHGPRREHPPRHESGGGSAENAPSQGGGEGSQAPAQDANAEANSEANAGGASEAATPEEGGAENAEGGESEQSA